MLNPHCSSYFTQIIGDALECEEDSNNALRKHLNF